MDPSQTSSHISSMLRRVPPHPAGRMSEERWQNKLPHSWHPRLIPLDLIDATQIASTRVEETSSWVQCLLNLELRAHEPGFRYSPPPS